jgi:endonuclease/exonuclease/phosphatase family metal-dependent hydrolase
MRKLAVVVLAALVGLGSWLFTTKYKIEGLDKLRVARRSPDGEVSTNVSSSNPPVRRTGDTIRIASFNIQVFGRRKLQKRVVADMLAGIVRRFDIVAIQEIRSRDQDVLPEFVNLVNAAGREYDYVIGPRIGRTSSKEQYAFVFDRSSVEVDRAQLYTVSDPDDLLHREPFVGWFRVRGPPESEAFTFTLVNIHTDPDEVQDELNSLDNVYRVVRDDGRKEDDVIILGDLNANDSQLGQLGEVSGITWVISGVPTNTRGTKQYDNLLFHEQATAEFVGRSGTFDFMREFNLTVEQALEVSDHLPVWAEFTVIEGGQIGRVATRPVR